MRTLYLIDEGSEKQWVSAETRDAAVAIVAKELYDGRTDEYRDQYNPKIIPLPPGGKVKVYQEQPFRDPSPFIEKTAQQWADSRAGIIASTCV